MMCSFKGEDEKRTTNATRPGPEGRGVKIKKREVCRSAVSAQVGQKPLVHGLRQLESGFSAVGKVCAEFRRFGWRLFGHFPQETAGKVPDGLAQGGFDGR
jgi:hypothetical protein